jgi:hypothetical protein
MGRIPMAEVQQGVTRRRWSWRQFWIALALLPVGAACSSLGLGIGLSVGSSTSTHDDWVYPIAEFAFLAGPWIAGAGILWLPVLVIRGPVGRFSLRTLFIAIALIALILAIYANAD